MATIEICVDSLDSALAACAGGADRLEVCSALSTGGLTPSLGFLRAVRSRTAIPLHVMIRPRPGDFLYSQDELALMRDDIAFARDAGADGVVFGLLTPAGLVDEIATRDLVQWSHPMQVTFHRAFDLVPDLDEALLALLRTGVHRVLTSGGGQTALEGAARLARLVHLGANRIIILVGGGVRRRNIGELVERTGAHEFHAGLRTSLPGPMHQGGSPIHLGDPGSDDLLRRVVHEDDVRALKQAAERRSASAHSV